MCVCVWREGGGRRSVCVCVFSLSLSLIFLSFELDLYGNLSVCYGTLPTLAPVERLGLRTEYVPYRTVRWLSKPQTCII